MPARRRVTIDGRTWIAEIDGDTVRLTDAGGGEVGLEVTQRAGDADGFDIRSEDGSRRAHAVAGTGSVWVQIEGAVFEVATDRAGRRATGADQDALTAAMAATVTRVAVRVGDTVARGDLLVALEAMKMELPVRAPRDAVVTAIHVREGALVQAGAVLVEVGDKRT